MQDFQVQRPAAPDRGHGSWLAIILTGLVGLAIVVTLTFLTLGSFGPVLLIGFLMFALVGFHYFVWGWWLQKVLRREQEQESEDSGT